MGRPYSQDLRDRVLASIDNGMSAGEVAELFQVDVSYVYKVVIRRRTIGVTTALPWAAGARRKLRDHEEALRGHVSEISDATLDEIRAWLVSEHGIKVSIGCLWNTLKRMRLPLKKNRSTLLSRTAKTLPRNAEPGMRLKAS